MNGMKTMDEIKLGVQQVVLESIEFRHRADPLEMSDKDRSPAGSTVEISTDMRLAEDRKGAAVRVRVACDAAESVYYYSVSYLVMLKFEAEITPQLQDQLIVTGGIMAMPFCREIVANLSSRARFGPTWLGPVDFAAIVRERNERRAAEAAIAASGVGPA